MSEYVVELKNCTKIFPGVKALDKMQLSVKPGEILGLIGENGAGKSTLIKVLTGVHKPDEGEIYVEGKQMTFHNPNDSAAAGIACVYQELNIEKLLSITDNIFINKWKKGPMGLLDYASMHKKAKEVMASLGQDVDPTKPAGTFGMGVQQMIEIAKAVLIDAKMIIMDEPTSSLGEKEVEQLMKTCRDLKARGIGIVFVSHKLEELFELCRKYNVLICADEVHCDLIMPDQEFLPAYSFSKYRNRMVTITAAAKTFSLALFSHCHIIIADPKLRKRFIAYQQKTHKGSVNVFNALPTYYSYQFGEEWLDAFNNVVFENYSYIRKELGKDLEICTLEGSYLLFINLEGYCQGKTAFDTLVKDCSIVANAGETFAKGYESWARLNLATSLKNIRKAVRNIKKLIKEKQQ